MLYDNFNVYDHYGVEEYLASHGLSVDKKYRGRAIGDEFLKTRYFCADWEWIGIGTETGFFYTEN